MHKLSKEFLEKRMRDDLAFGHLVSPQKREANRKHTAKKLVQMEAELEANDKALREKFKDNPRMLKALRI